MALSPTLPSVAVDPSGHHAILRGSLAGDAAAHLVTQVAKTCSPCDDLCLDLSHVGVVDSTGLAVLRALARRHRAHHSTVRVVGATPHVCELLTLIGVQHAAPTDTGASQ